eukprot:m51a1_g9694 putative calcium calmodulin-dependent -cyclic nucleotide phosphodiesterase (598) ;mRNA; r:1362927-1364829
MSEFKLSPRGTPGEQLEAAASSHLTLRFLDADLERQYADSHARTTESRSRRGLVTVSVGALLMACAIAPMSARKWRTFEFAAIVVAEMLCFAATFTPLRRARLALQSVALWASCVVLLDATAAATEPYHSLNARTVVPFLVTLLSGHTAQRLPFVHYSLVVSATVASFFVYTFALGAWAETWEIYTSVVVFVFAAAALVVEGTRASPPTQPGRRLTDRNASPLARESDRADRASWLFMSSLRSEVNGLRAELGVVEHMHKELDLQSPVEKIITSVQWIRKTAAAGAVAVSANKQGIVDQCNFVLSTLTQKMNLFSVDIDAQIKDGCLDMDSEIADYLLQEVCGRSFRGDQGSAGSLGAAASVESLDSVMTSRGEGSADLQSMLKRATTTDLRSASPRCAAGTSTPRGKGMGRLRIESVRSSASMEDIPVSLEMPPADLFARFDSWDWDTFAFRAGAPMPLSSVFAHVADKYNFAGIVGDHYFPQLKRFVAAVEKLYLPTPYHSSLHAADVVHAVDKLLAMGPRSHLQDVDLLALFVAAAIHDVGHPGRNNNFHVMSGSDLALLYNDKSVLENYHLSTSMKILRKPGFYFIKGLSAKA